MSSGRFVAYYRVSTQEQGRSGLGLEAQRDAVMRHLNGGAWTLDAEFVEIESGKRSDRPKLAEAIKLCRKRKATLIIAKLDRLSRNVAFIANLMESRVNFLAVDNPNANPLHIHILAAVAQHEREMISTRTKAALAAAKERRRRDNLPPLGNRTNLPEARALANAARSAKADQHAANVLPVIQQIQSTGATTLRAIAGALNARGIKTPRGGEWHAKQVQLVMQRQA
ncbi:resolvase [Alsobacter soli]|uniref:Resolvase n=1 Tax=Alsobacter soli TaxID=2109933 RepID=A0A2T1HM02_9HYPH|nr:recombinase family protein [Alsobacter soli]PSC02685.1 resolvase [Alsobacter soli]